MSKKSLIAGVLIAPLFVPDFGRNSIARIFSIPLRVTSENKTFETNMFGSCLTKEFDRANLFAVPPVI